MKGKGGLGHGGFSLVEAMIALSVGTIFLGSVLSTLFFTSKTWQEEQRRFKTRLEVEKSLERIKTDIRLSNADSVLYYPSGGAAYTGISIPRATPNGSGYLTFSGGQIVWDQTVVYHVYDNTATGLKELRRTVFDNYNSNLTARQTQLNNCVTDGTDTGGTTTVLGASDTITMEVSGAQPNFDGYNASVTRSSLTSFGSVRLNSGTHQVRFEVVSKNASSTGYKMGVDSLAFSPSGSLREAEVLTVSASSGQTVSTEDMTAYTSALWGGNYQRQYASSAMGNYMTFDVNYDEWLESNFASVSHSYTEVTGTNPSVSVSSRESQGLSPAWQANIQAAPATISNDASAAGMSVRSIVAGNQISLSGQMMRLKFTAAPNAALSIGPAYFGIRTAGTPSFAAIPIQLYFDNDPVAEGGTDPEGSTDFPGTNTAITIPAGSYAWTNWFIYTITSPSAVDYLVSMYVQGGSATIWTPNPPGVIHSYRVDGDQALTTVWPQPPLPTLPGYAENTGVYASAELAVWQNTGTVTSQIYDTRMTAPDYSQISWTSSIPTVTLKVRSSNSLGMSGATDWGLIAPLAASPASLASLADQRYVQWQATLTAASPYTSLPTLDDVRINWPGQTALVEVTGYYTKKPDYGIFKVLVDGVQPTSEITVKITASEDYRGKSYNFSAKTGQKPMNTGK